MYTCESWPHSWGPCASACPRLVALWSQRLCAALAFAAADATRSSVTATGQSGALSVQLSCSCAHILRPRSRSEGRGSSWESTDDELSDAADQTCVTSDQRQGCAERRRREGGGRTPVR
eukprot:3679853-Pleurochrysis_carterae.AAC.2